MATKTLTLILTAMLIAGCERPVQELGEQLGCIGKGTACSDPAHTNEIADLERSIKAVETQLASITARVGAIEGRGHVLELVDPCGDTPGKYDELLIRFSDNTLVSSFSDAASGLNTRLAAIPPGSYLTTDGTSCSFVVGTNGSVTPSTKRAF